MKALAVSGIAQRHRAATPALRHPLGDTTTTRTAGLNFDQGLLRVLKHNELTVRWVGPVPGDNAAMESFFSLLELERFGPPGESWGQLRIATVSRTERISQRLRGQRVLGFLTSIELENWELGTELQAA